MPKGFTRETFKFGNNQDGYFMMNMGTTMEKGGSPLADPQLGQVTDYKPHRAVRIKHISRIPGIGGEIIISDDFAVQIAEAIIKLNKKESQ